ncbi:prephenate dehydrogenase [Rhizobium rhizogenes]|uniref:prephenate dehydrogenase n=1 Tax=Rhizobium rhizogenes TaxID=359 RepID=UPI001572D101|nr:prephenate dehydrogenase [Rhizobium rhizogenes]NTH23026.1 prephenate dehydrogenase [Rhizobium rhizogenes]NTH36056.1 prephenate dehydrogenase [Rhizobium rhizogenes]
MPDLSPQLPNGSVGIVGFGAFGQLIAEHLRPHFKISVFDIAPDIARADALDVSVLPFEAVAECPIVVLAIPVGRMREVVADLALLIKPGTLVVDVGSVKVEPVAIMRELLPETVGIVGTHPLFGPQSARSGIHGRRIAICPVRGTHLGVAALCRKVGLEVIMTTPDEHDRDAAQVQGLTHFIANLLVKMDLRQTRMTTRSFEALMSAVEMVRHDAPEVIQAILGTNPYAGDVLKRFKSLASTLDVNRL